MKSFTKKIIKTLVRIDCLWKLYKKAIIPLINYTNTARTAWEKKQQPVALPYEYRSIFADMTVRHGVFKGMKLSRGLVAQDSFYPKLIGCYENEIKSLLKTICAQNYTEIINVGCAEGYYAVGLAMNIASAKVYAFDIDHDSIQLCEEMARLNNVSDRVFTGGFCNADTFKEIPLTKRALILSDCEGYEKELFTAENVSLFSKHDLLIEVHDFIDIQISSYLRKLFDKTHTITVRSSIDDIQKAQKYSFNEIESFDLSTKLQVLSERRPAIMEWFYLKPKTTIAR